MAVILVAGAALLLGAVSDGSDAEDWAARAGLDAADVKAAAATVGVSAYVYLVGEGALVPLPVPTRDPYVERRLDCIQRYESGGNPNARNPRSGAAGPYQFLAGTWASTPQGRAGASPYDPVAAREAARWMLGQGRAREWEVVTRGLC